MKSYTSHARRALAAILRPQWAGNQTAETCELQWVDKSGNPTPDDNPAIGWVRGRAHERVIWGRLIRFEPTLWSPICAEHAKRLHEPGMELWEFEAYTP
jgi:hypothetical protein